MRPHVTGRDSVTSRRGAGIEMGGLVEAAAWICVDTQGCMNPALSGRLLSLW